MPVALSYPGLYLEEIPSSARSIVAAPTSLAVFVGYTHPFKTKAYGKPVRIFSFADFEREFGGVYHSDNIDGNVAMAVYQFFVNGGSEAYVVGLKPRYYLGGGLSEDVAKPGHTLATTDGGIVFKGLEPTDNPKMTMRVTLSNIRESAAGAGLDMADFTITYGNRVENYRGVKLTESSLNASINQASSLISVEPDAAGYGTAFTAAGIPAFNLTTTVPAGFVSAYSAADFLGVFQADAPLDKVEIFNLLILPGISDNSVLSAALAFAERKQAFLIMDPPANAGADAGNPPAMEDVFNSGAIPTSQNGAIYFPYLKTSSPLNAEDIELPPSGFIAGVFARTDTRRGVWKAPAGLEAQVKNTSGVVDAGRMTDQRQGVLNKLGVNCLRAFSGLGTVVYGARTLVAGNPAFQQNKYVPVRRMTLFIEQTLLQNLKWVVFEPNDEPLWLAIRDSIESFMLSLMDQGALQGSTPSKAFQVKCDSSTTTADDVNNGIVNIVVSFAPLKPAEFVVIKIAHLAGQTQA